MENYKAAGDRVVIVANHQSYLDACLIAAYVPDSPTFAIHTSQAAKWYFKPFLAAVDTFPVDVQSPYSVKRMVEAVRDHGRKLMIFPEGRMTRTGALMKVYEGAALVADRSHAQVLPDQHRRPAIQSSRPHGRQAASALVPASQTEHPAAGHARAAAHRKPVTAPAPRGDRPRSAGRDGGCGVPLEGDRQEPVRRAAGRARTGTEAGRRSPRTSSVCRSATIGWWSASVALGRALSCRCTGRSICRAADAECGCHAGCLHGAAGVRRRALHAEHLGRRCCDVVCLPRRRRPHRRVEPHLRGEGAARPCRAGPCRAKCASSGWRTCVQPSACARSCAPGCDAWRARGLPGASTDSGFTGGRAVHQRFGGQSQGCRAEPPQPARQLRAACLGDRLPVAATSSSMPCRCSTPSA